MEKLENLKTYFGQERKKWIWTAVLGFGIGIILIGLGFELKLSIAIGLLSALIGIAIQIYQKQKLKIIQEKTLELKLGKGLQEIGLQVSLGFSLEHCFSRMAQKEGVLGEEFQIIQKDLEKHGKGLGQALMNAVHRHDSKTIKQAFLQLIFVYEHGNKAEQEAESLEKIGAEIMKNQIMELREYHSKISVYSIFFVALSAIVPALFFGFSIIGSAFLDLGMTSLEIWIVSLLIFPILNSGLLLVIQEKTPSLLKTEKNV